MSRADGGEIQAALNTAAEQGTPIQGCTIKLKPVGLNLMDEGLAQAIGQSIAFSTG